MDLTPVAYATLALSLFVSAIKMGGWILNADPRTLLKASRWSLLPLTGLALALLVWLVNTGRSAAAMMLAAFMLPVFVQAAPRWRSLFGMHNAVRSGFPQGAGLDPSTVSSSAVWREPPNTDLVQQSITVLRAYLEQTGHCIDHPSKDRHRATHLLSRPVNGSAGRQPQMSTAEALHVLGLEPHSSAEEIRDAHRRLMHIVDPRSGGTHYLIMKVNEAREVLLGG